MQLLIKVPNSGQRETVAGRGNVGHNVFQGFVTAPPDIQNEGQPSMFVDGDWTNLEEGLGPTRESEPTKYGLTIAS